MSRARTPSPIANRDATAPIPSASLIGSRQVRIKRELGSGAFGQAFLADSPFADTLGLPRGDFVVKHIPLTRRRGSDDVVREVLLLRRLEHPHVVRLYGAWLETGPALQVDHLHHHQQQQHGTASLRASRSLCVALQYCRGGDLSMVLKSVRSSQQCGLPSSVCAALALQMLAALDYIHSQHVISRDIKPANVFLRAPLDLSQLSGAGGGAAAAAGTTPEFVLGDFGVGRCLEHTDAMAKTRVGTPYYVAPALVAGLPYSNKADVWSLGVLLFEVIAGERPFHCGRDTDGIDHLYMNILKVDPMPRLREVVARKKAGGCEAWLLDLVGECLAKDEAVRPTARFLLTEWRPEVIAPRLEAMQLAAAAVASTGTHADPIARSGSPVGQGGSAGGQRASPLREARANLQTPPLAPQAVPQPSRAAAGGGAGAGAGGGSPLRPPALGGAFAIGSPVRAVAAHRVGAGGHSQSPVRHAPSPLSNVLHGQQQQQQQQQRVFGGSPTPRVSSPAPQPIPLANNGRASSPVRRPLSPVREATVDVIASMRRLLPPLEWSVSGSVSGATEGIHAPSDPCGSSVPPGTPHNTVQDAERALAAALPDDAYLIIRILLLAADKDQKNVHQRTAHLMHRVGHVLQLWPNVDARVVLSMVTEVCHRSG